MRLPNIRAFFRNVNQKLQREQVPQIDETKIRGGKVFNRAFGRYLLLTNTGLCGGLMFMGDLIQQELEYRRKSLPKRYDWLRAGRMFMVGIITGPVNHYFYKYLDDYIPKRNLVSITRKVMIDQLVMSPVSIAMFFYLMGLMEGNTWEECSAELNRKFVEVYLIDWSVWPPSQFINFYFLPVQYQVAYINFLTMVYNIYLSYMKHREQAQENRKKYYNDYERNEPIGS